MGPGSEVSTTGPPFGFAQGRLLPLRREGWGTRPRRVGHPITKQRLGQVKAPNVGMSLEPRLSQECQLCGQGIDPQQQMPVNAILIHGHGMCPLCRQLVSNAKQDEEVYCENWRLFVLQLELDT